VLPTDIPFGLDRLVTAASLSGGAVLVAIGITWLVDPARRQRDERVGVVQPEA
jgi:hypothetical protein